jgi:uroporphyrinogen-III synthase
MGDPIPKNVLIYRPLPAASRTARRIEALGHIAYLYPFIDLEMMHTPMPQGDFDGVIITSEAVFETGTELGALLDLPLYMVGERTHVAAREAGFANVHHVALTSAQLLKHTLSMHKDPQRWLYVTGVERKKTLEEGLTEANHVVIPWEVYYAKAASDLPASLVDLIRKRRIDTVMHYSARSALIFQELIIKEGLQDAIRSMQHLVMSEHVASIFHGESRFPLRVAGTPTEEAMLSILC